MHASIAAGFAGKCDNSKVPIMCIIFIVLPCMRPQVRSVADSIEAIGLGSWRLRGRMSGPFERLAAVIEGTWRQAFDMELSSYNLPEARLCFCRQKCPLCWHELCQLHSPTHTACCAVSDARP